MRLTICAQRLFSDLLHFESTVVYWIVDIRAHKHLYGSAAAREALTPHHGQIHSVLTKSWLPGGPRQGFNLFDREPECWGSWEMTVEVATVRIYVQYIYPSTIRTRDLLSGRVRTGLSNLVEVYSIASRSVRIREIKLKQGSWPHNLGDDS
jgi:hypothetical protein